jgi:GH35 family endo-1,4-beta-xylanase
MSAFISRTWKPAELDTLLYHWIKAAMNSNENAAKVDYWNVINEAFMWNGDYWHNLTTDANADKCPWQDMGWETDKSNLTGTQKVYSEHPIYIARAFRVARQFTQAKLELRDYSIEFWDGSKKARAFYQLVKHLLNSGVPLDAVGFQGHFRTDLTYDWPKLSQAVQEYRKLGLEVYFTEVDIGDADPVAPNTTAHRSATQDNLQARYYHDFIKAAVEGGVTWICTWGIADNTNPDWRMGQSALLFDEQYNAKPAYLQFRQGLEDGLNATGLSKNPKPVSPRPQVRQIESTVKTKRIVTNNTEWYQVSGSKLKK